MYWFIRSCTRSESHGTSAKKNVFFVGRRCFFFSFTCVFFILSAYNGCESEISTISRKYVYDNIGICVRVCVTDACIIKSTIPYRFVYTITYLFFFISLIFYVSYFANYLQKKKSIYCNFCLIFRTYTCV